MSKRNGERCRQLGLNIAYYRKRRRMTQEQLAELVSVSRTHISNIEATYLEKTPSLDLLFDIADALDITISDLFAPH